MSTTVLMPVSEYLEHAYNPDCEYLEGILQERNVGEIGHSDAQGRTYLFVQTQLRGFWSGVDVRLQVRQDRFRIPDVIIVRGGKPSGRIVTAPPEVAVEVLSPDDRAADIQDKIDDCLAFGVPCVWVIRTDTRRAWIHTKEGSHEVRDGVLRNPSGDVMVPLPAIFAE